MTQYVSIMPREISVIVYEPSTGSITIGTSQKSIELLDKNVEYFDFLVENAMGKALMMIDVNEKLERTELDACYKQCIAIFQNHVVCMEYNTEENGSVIVTTDAGELTTCDYTLDDYKKMQKDLLKNKCLIIKKTVIKDFEIPDFSKVKKLR